MQQLATQPANGLHGTLAVPGDKSISHRGIMIGAISQGTTTLQHFLASADCLSTLAAFQQLGVKIDRQGTTVKITGQGLTGLKASPEPLDMGNSGTTTRLLMGLLAGQPFTTRLIGDASLSKRPMLRVSEPLAAMGAKIETTEGTLPATIEGQSLRATNQQLKVASAQVKSALILAALQADGPSVIKEKLATRDHTERMLNQFGASVKTSADGLTITVQDHPNLVGQTVNIPGDMSSAAFFITAATLTPNSKITLKNVGMNSTRTGLLELVQKMGGHIQVAPLDQSGEPSADLTVESANLHGIEIGAEEIPAVIDELPLVALLAAHAEGTTRITGAGELRVKETDRIATVATELRKVGAEVSELPDGLVIVGKHDLTVKESQLDSHGDHRIGMMGAIAALQQTSPMTLANAEAIDISYPEFFTDLATLL